jgi:hypothetical protein
MLTEQDMSSLTNVINIIEVIVKHNKVEIPLETENLVHRLDRCVTLQVFDKRHEQQLGWIRREAQNEKLERLCEDVALSLRPVIMRAHLLKFYTSHGKPLPAHYLSDRHVVVLALDDVLQAFKTFRVVNQMPDFNAVHIRAMIRVYLRETFELMFLLGKIASPQGADRRWFRCWQFYLAESQFEDFKFDSENDYPSIDQPHLEKSSIQAVLADPAEVPASCLPYHCTGPALLRNFGPYGPAIL